MRVMVKRAKTRAAFTAAAAALLVVAWALVLAGAAFAAAQADVYGGVRPTVTFDDPPTRGWATRSS